MMLATEQEVSRSQLSDIEPSNLRCSKLAVKCASGDPCWQLESLLSIPSLTRIHLLDCNNKDKDWDHPIELHGSRKQYTDFITRIDANMDAPARVVMADANKSTAFDLGRKGHPEMCLCAKCAA